MCFLIYGNEFSVSIGVSRILIIGSLAAAINIPGSAYYNSIGRPGRILPYAFISIIIHVILAIVLIPWFGIHGAAIAFCISQIFVAITNIIFLTRRTGLPSRTFIIISVKDINLLYKKFSSVIKSYAH